MTVASSRLIDIHSTPYYHITCRCVRRAFLCGVDSYTGKDYEHRRSWIEDKLFDLTSVFAIDVAAYAVMSNHYHLVLRIDNEQAQSWSTREVLERWARLFNGSLMAQRYLAGALLSEAELEVLSELVEDYRERLMSISWLMRILNESIARQANREDNCTGKFFEGRFKSQALLDEAALLSCMAYVDLNPVRAKMATTPEASDYTSIQARIQQDVEKALLPFIGNERQEQPKGIAFDLTDYLELVDWSGRAIRHSKRGSIPAKLPPILERLNLSEDDWLLQAQHFEKRFKRAAGHWYNLSQLAHRLGQHWLHGKSFKPKTT
ncbi:transposase [Kangiella sediminilitoris]|uniref:Transposase n=1 Tax=Kangiella sediminilitoris TaxID=1144748 RepID=A0A1B3BA07_9GAMM|nr:transposase [Kangiella sediminilitoris]AOE49639.1 Transposase [Kangiella sediminilitoris]